MKKTDLAWAAGIIDGEGCIVLQRLKRHDGYGSGLTFDLRAEVANTDFRLINKLKDMFGGGTDVRSYEKRSNRRPCKKVYWHAQKAANVLKAVFPYLVIKQEQARIAIQTRKWVRHDRKPNETKQRKLIAASLELRRLKRISWA